MHRVHQAPSSAAGRRARRAALAAALAAAGTVVAASGASSAGAAPSAAGKAGATARAAAAPTTPATGPLGWEHYRQLDRLPELAGASRSHQQSSFDREGANDHDGFDGKYSCLRSAGTDCVIAEHDGPGEVASIWFTRDEGDVTRTGNLTIELDGETVLDAPLQDVVDGKLGAPFVQPLVGNADQQSGGVVIKVPMPFERSMRISTDTNPLFYHVDFRTFDPSADVATFDPQDPATDVLDALKTAGTQDPKPRRRQQTQTRSLDLAPGKGAAVAATTGPGMLSAVDVRLPQVVGPVEGEKIHDDGRAFKGSSAFTVAVDPANEGVKLTRRLDRIIGNQVADVYVDGQLAGRWEPLPAAGGIWTDQTVTIPAALTQGKSSLRVENRFVSSDLDFNEFHYWVDSTVAGADRRTDEVDVGPEHLADEQAHDYVITDAVFEGQRDYSYGATGDPDAIAASDDVLRNLRLRISFDGRTTVDAPVGEFYGSGISEYARSSLFFRMDPDGWYQAWWPMPYRQGAKVELVNGSGQAVRGAKVRVRDVAGGGWARRLGPQGDAGYFHATSHRGPTTPGRDWTLLDAQGRGKLVGTSASMEDGPGSRLYLEGDERFHVDGSGSPAWHGTGSEDYYESGWYFNRGPYSALLSGDSSETAGVSGCAAQCDAAYRLLVPDALSFDRSLRAGIEHGPVNDVQATYGSTAYWYGRERANLATTDTLDVGDRASELDHAYRSPGNGGVQTLTSTYEGDDDTVAATDEGRATTEPVRFTVAVDPANRGVLLRRRSDQRDAYQAARVVVDGRDAGTWREPLSNATHRWLDDELQLPSALTAGKSRLKVQLLPLDGAPAWHAARYEALSRTGR